MKDSIMQTQKLENQKETKSSLSWQQEILKVRTEFNELETKNTIKKSVNPKAGSLRR